MEGFFHRRTLGFFVIAMLVFVRHTCSITDSDGDSPDKSAMSNALAFILCSAFTGEGSARQRGV